MSWPVVQFKDVAQVVTGTTPKKNDENYNGEIPFVTPGDLGEHTVITSAKVNVTEQGANTGRLLPKGAVLVCCIGATIGKVGISGKNVISNQQINSLVFDETKIFPKYAYYYCLTIKPLLISRSSSTTMPIVNKTNFSKFEIPLPPLVEQKRIAAILDKADAIRQKRKQAIKLADDFLRSVFLDMFGDPVTNPKGWDVKPVGTVVDCIVPGRDKPKSFTGKMPWITTNDLNHLQYSYLSDKAIGLTDEEIVEVKAKIIPQGSVLMTCVGDLGVISIAGNDIIMNQQLHAFLINDEINREFLMYALSFQKNYMFKMASTTTVPYMNKTNCNSVPVILPSLELQNEFSEIYKKLNGSKETTELSSIDCEKLFNSLSQKAFVGDL